MFKSKPTAARSACALLMPLALFLVGCGGGGGGDSAAPPAPCTAGSIGSCWTVRSSGPGNDLDGVASSPSLTVAVGQNGTIKTSADGITYQTLVLGTDEYLGVTYDGSLFAAVGGTTLATSPDGVNWTTIPLQIQAYRVSGTATLRVLGTLALTVPAHILTPDNAAPVDVACIYTMDSTGNLAFPATPCTNQVVGLIYTGSQYVAVGANGLAGSTTALLMTSPDGNSWTDRAPPTSAPFLAGVATSGSLTVAVGAGGTILTSTDGASWTPVVSGTTQALNGVSWSGALWVVVGDGGTVLTSPDGSKWTVQNSGTKAPLLSVTHNGTRFVAVGSANTLITSP